MTVLGANIIFASQICIYFNIGERKKKSLQYTWFLFLFIHFLLHGNMYIFLGSYGYHINAKYLNFSV